MKLSETTFIVCVNKAFIDKLRIGPDQIFWFIREAAKKLDISEWEKNDKSPNDLICWYHPVLIRDAIPGIIEAIPYPKGYLLLTVSKDEKTIPWPINDDVFKILYPDAFSEIFDKTQKELRVIRAISEVPEGQNRHGAL